MRALCLQVGGLRPLPQTRVCVSFGNPSCPLYFSTLCHRENFVSPVFRKSFISFAVELLSHTKTIGPKKRERKVKHSSSPIFVMHSGLDVMRFRSGLSILQEK